MIADAPRYIFSGHAIGAAAQFHRLDQTHNLNHVVPTLGASVLPVTGGVSKAEVNHFCFTVDEPRRRSLLGVRKIATMAAGRDLGDRFETEVEAEIESVHVVEKLHIEHVSLHILSTLLADGSEPLVTTRGNRIDGMRLGKVQVRVELDDEPLCSCGNQAQLAKFYASKDGRYRRQNAWRFRTDPKALKIAAHGPHYKFSLVRKIKLIGPQAEKQKIHVEGYTIHWEGFGRIVLGEAHVKGNDRQLTMVRLAMGSDAAGPALVGDGQSNGQTGS
jgi:hypothetical protein